MDLKSLEKKIDEISSHKFKDLSILKTSLTHSSYINEHDLSFEDCNERLEFLGDAILDLVIGEYLFSHYTSIDEGELTKRRSLLVNKDVLADASRRLNLGEFLYLGHGEEINEGRNKDSILADALESLIGAIYMDGGFKAAKKFILKFLLPILNGKIFVDYKTSLQEACQKKKDMPIYKLIRSGSDDSREAKVQLKALGNEVTATAHNKKEAEQLAAKIMLEKLKKK